MPGKEKVTIALAKYPITPSSGSAYSVQGSTTAYTGQTPYADCAGSGGVGSKGMYAEESSPSLDCMRSNHSAGSVGSKGMYAEEDTASAAPASYSVVPASALNDGQVLFVDFNLTHR